MLILGNPDYHRNRHVLPFSSNLGASRENVDRPTTPRMFYIVIGLHVHIPPKKNVSGGPLKQQHARIGLAEVNLSEIDLETLFNSYSTEACTKV